ncbi:MAG: hypothetical protein SF123_07265 [Chloroflexota bacterium]|nr:hypothetical protein [Chloroflexota bacterium]
MTSPKPLLTRSALACMLAIFALLVSVYLLIYSGYIESGDSRYLFNATASQYRYGDMLLDLSASERLPEQVDPDLPYPLQRFDTELMQPLLAQPLYALANAVPGIGLVHTTWMFNIVVTALTGCIVFLFARALAFDTRAAVLVALMYGLATIAVPYSKTFFREPLTALTITAAALLAERTRAHNYRPWSLLLLIISIVVMLLTRAAAVFALPALLVLLLPDAMTVVRRASLGRILLIIIGVIALAAAVFVGAAVLGGGRYNILARLDSDFTYIITALHSYMLSIGGSIWATSPPLLLAIPGIYLFWRHGLWRYALALPLLLLTFTFGYALFIDQHWFGGLSWPPRFLAPTVPLLMLGVLPIVSALWKREQRSRLVAVALIVVTLVLVVYGVWVQTSAVSVRWGDYTRGLPAEANGTIEWGGGLNVVQYLRPVVIPQLWATVPLDFAWVRMGQPIWGWVFGVSVVVCGAWLLWTITSPRRYGLASSSVLLAVVFIIAGLYLRALHNGDFEYRATDGELHQLVSAIQRETQRGDVVLLSNPAYVDFMLNYGKFADDARVIALPLNPGDRPSPEQPALVSDDNPDALVRMQVIPLIYGLAQERDRIWLVENFGAAHPWSVRPVERFLSTHYYPIHMQAFGDLARLIEFSTAETPDTFGFALPQYASPFLFSDALRLHGYTLPLGNRYAPGAALPISLYWSADLLLVQDYTVAVYLAPVGGVPLAQSDTQPGWGFAPTTVWQPGISVWDHRALRLPTDIVPGEYELWIKVYGFDENFQPQDLPAMGGVTRDGVIAVLPIPIIVDAS